MPCICFNYWPFISLITSSCSFPMLLDMCSLLPSKKWPRKLIIQLDNIAKKSCIVQIWYHTKFFIWYVTFTFRYCESKQQKPRHDWWLIIFKYLHTHIVSVSISTNHMVTSLLNIFKFWCANFSSSFAFSANTNQLS